jgi:hypothetical protein
VALSMVGRRRRCVRSTGLAVPIYSRSAQTMASSIISTAFGHRSWASGTTLQFRPIFSNLEVKLGGHEVIFLSKFAFEKNRSKQAALGQIARKSNTRPLMNCFFVTQGRCAALKFPTARCSRQFGYTGYATRRTKSLLTLQ